jgi:hypothetical protein
MSSLRRYLSVAVLVAFAGCAGGSTPGSPPAVPSGAAHSSSGVHSAVCTPTVWASSLSSNAVYGYTAANSPPCITLTGPFNGLNFNAPIAVAIGRKPHRLYVADLNNYRIVVFTYKGVFVKALNTTMGTVNYQPWGVCVDSAGVVGVGNRQYNNTGTYGNAEFFKQNAANNSGPTGWATGILATDAYCAFDKKGNFFVEGAALAGSGGGQQIAYLAKGHVGNGNSGAQLLVNSALGNASFWNGMYSRINSPVDDTLSVGTSVGNSATQTVITWKVAGPLNGPLAFAAPVTYTLTGYPVTTDAVYQLAPSKGGSLGTLYVADYGDGEVLSTCANGCAVAAYNSVGGAVGVATQPTGQY